MYVIIRTYENCYEKAKECDFDLSIFINKHPGRYKAYRRYKYDIPLKRNMKKSGYWTYDICKNIVKKYDSVSELFEKESGCRYAISRNNWQHLLEDIHKEHKPNNYWNNFDNCYKEALKYKTKSEFRSEAGSCYISCKLNGWLQTVCKHITSTEREVYILEFQDKVAYIGLTINFARRYSSHKGSRSELSEFIKSSKTNIIRSDKMNELEASKLETKLILQYKNNGWYLLNKNNGGSLGGKIPNIGANNLRNYIKRKNKNWLICNVVHDSAITEIDVEDIYEYAEVAERLFTTNVMDYFNALWDIDFIAPIEIDFDFGTKWGELKAWDFSPQSLKEMYEDLLIKVK